ncbi:TIR domain-containing protein [Frankia sp. AgB32]|uniref:nSTAND1 domain-containing NTPase n=1 Tax=Frankia sp. AgB32 TaxID=631119 RepID=UPI00200D775A|nr:TIR domain-containing protein [Frankia sp. AgB32]MCK9894858.1 TIR domain-containing protein [Frankia sp. AgB32]
MTATSGPAAERRIDPDRFDVFLSYNRDDGDLVAELAAHARHAGMAVWFDRWQIAPGDLWQANIEAALSSSRSCAILVGPAGFGRWEREELRAALIRTVERPAEFRVFPVLLPGVVTPFDETTMPLFLRSRAWLDLRTGLGHRTGLALRDAVDGTLAQDGRASARRPADSTGISPYPGLTGFDQESARFFFGRAAETQRVLEVLRGGRFVAVVGVSGSGKSSLALAGVLPALAARALPGSHRWPVLVLRPGALPLDTLAATMAAHMPALDPLALRDQLAASPETLHLRLMTMLAGPAAPGGVLLVVDQFEEALTAGLGAAEFVASLAHAATVEGGPVRVLLTMRADFYSRAADFPALSGLLVARQFLLGPMKREKLREAIVGPAALCELEFSATLVETILDDAGTEAGALPLMQHALRRLYERRSGSVLTLAAYREIGRVDGSLALHADGILAGLTESQRRAARGVLLRLTAVGDGTGDTRRRLHPPELVTTSGGPAEVAEVIRVLVDARLLTAGTEPTGGAATLEITHEALIRHWPVLRAWVDDDRAGHRLREQLTGATKEWVAAGEEPGLLFGGTRLAVLLAWSQDHPGDLTGTESRFLTASVAARERVQAQERLVREERRRHRERVRLAIGATVVLTIAALVGATFGLIAQSQKRDADRQRTLTRSVQLAAQADELRASRPDLAAVLAVEANAISPTIEARGSLLNTVAQTPGLVRVLRPTSPASGALTVDVAGDLLATASQDHSISLWRPATGQLVTGPLAGHDAPVVGIGVDGAAARMTSVDLRGRLLVWDLHTFAAHQAGGLRHPVSVATPSPDGRTLAVATDASDVLVVNVDDGALIRSWPPAGRPVTALAFTLDGQSLAVGDTAGMVTTLSLVEPDRRTAPAPVGASSRITALAFSPDGGTLAAAADDRAVHLWDTAAARPRSDPMSGHRRDLTAIAYLQQRPDPTTGVAPGPLLLTASTDQALGVWDGTFQTPGARFLAGQQDAILGLATSDAGVVATAGRNGTIALWDVTGHPTLARALVGHQAAVSAAVYSPDGRLLASADYAGRLLLRDARTAAVIRVVVEGGPPVSALAWTPRGQRLIVGYVTGAGRLLDVTGVPRASWRGTGNGQVVDLAAGADGRVLVVATSAGFEIRSVADGSLIRQIHTTPLAGMALRPDGAVLAAGGEDATVTLWNVMTGRRLAAPLIGHGLRVPALAFSPDGATLATGSDDQKIILWDPSAHAMLAELRAHTDQVWGLTFRADGRVLASASEDDTIVLWDVASRRPIGRPLRYGDDRTDHFALRVQFRADGRALISHIGTDLVLWNTDERQWPGLACSLAARPLSAAEGRQYLRGGSATACLSPARR